MIDKIFKIGLLVLGFLYLAYLFCPVSNQVGRYRSHISEEGFFISDTTNADVYTFAKERWVLVNPKTGKSDSIDIIPFNKEE